MYDLIEKHFKENYSKFMKIIWRRAGSLENAEDIIQETYTRALLYADSYDPRRPLDGWIITILNNSLRGYKADERRLGMAIEYDEETEWGWAMDDWASDLISRIKKDINRQPEPYRTIYSLYFMKQYLPRDISLVVDATGNKVRSAVKRYKRVLEERYGETMCR